MSNGHVHSRSPAGLETGVRFSVATRVGLRSSSDWHPLPPKLTSSLKAILRGQLLTFPKSADLLGPLRVRGGSHVFSKRTFQPVALITSWADYQRPLRPRTCPRSKATGMSGVVKGCRTPALTRRWRGAVGRRRTSLKGGNRGMPRGRGENGLRGYGDLKDRT
jgi:hypothetical protein